MYLWNTKSLAKELKEGTLSESDKFKYFIVGVILYNIPIMLPSSGEYSIDVYYLLRTLVMMSIICIGTYLCYRVNYTAPH
jgi:hypothetical protein